MLGLCFGPRDQLWEEPKQFQRAHLQSTFDNSYFDLDESTGSPGLGCIQNRSPLTTCLAVPGHHLPGPPQCLLAAPTTPPRQPSALQAVQPVGHEFGLQIHAHA